MRGKRGDGGDIRPVVVTSQTRSQQPTLLTVEELANRWGVTARLIRSQIDLGRIKALRIGRLIKISRSHVEFVENGGNNVSHGITER